MLEDPEYPIIKVLQVFVHRVRHEHYSSRMSSFRADTVALAWRAIYETHLLEGRRDPQKPLGLNSRELENLFSRMIRHYGFQDPPHGVKSQSPWVFVNGGFLPSQTGRL